MRVGLSYMIDWESEGYSIVGEAANGTEAMNAIRLLRPEIVITDVRMPGVSGIDLTGQIHAEYPEISVFVLTEYDDFQYVREAFLNGASDFVLKTDLNAENLLRMLRKHRTVQEKRAGPRSSAQFLLLSLTQRENLNHHNVQEELREAGVKLTDSSTFRLISGLAVRHDMQLSERLRDRLEKICSGCCESSEYICVIAPDTEIIAMIPDAYCGDIVRVFQEQADSSEIREAGFTFAVSDPVRILSAVYSEHQRLLEIHKHYFYEPGHRFMDSSVIGTRKTEFNRREYMRNIGSLNFQEARSLSETFFRECIKNHYPEPFVLKKEIEEHLFLALNAFDNLGAVSDRIASMKIRMLRSIDEAEDYILMERAFQSFWNTIETEAQSMLRNPKKDTMDTIHEYVQRHCAEEIRLSDVASIFNLNYSYLSKLFRQTYNEGFSDYLQRVRIERAKELMRSPDLSLSEISSMVGFSDQSYFSKLFRKYENQTPMQYSKSIRHKK